jgi:Phospholipase_D-nuclease N-terminal
MARKRQKKRWSELPKGQRRGIVGVGIVQVGLWIAALLDIRRRPADAIKGSKPMWVALSFVNTIGPLAYFAFGRRKVTPGA